MSKCIIFKYKRMYQKRDAFAGSREEVSRRRSSSTLPFIKTTPRRTLKGHEAAMPWRTTVKRERATATSRRYINLMVGWSR